MSAGPSILLLNPNTNATTTAMMAGLLQQALPAGWQVTGATAASGVPMVVNPAEMAHAALAVAASWQRHAHQAWDAVVVSAFGDPGMDAVRAATPLPVVGICEAALLEAADGGRRRFGIATVTPDLVALIDGRVHALGLGPVYTGTRLTPGEPRALAAQPQALEEALWCAAQACVQHDGAQAVVIGGGPLGQAARALQPRMAQPVVAPLEAAARQLRQRLGA